MTEPKRVQASVPQFMEEQQMDISQLPIELIPLIVRFVNEVDEGTDAIDIETDLAARKPSYPFKTFPEHQAYINGNLHALSLVNSTFMSLCRPYAWSNLDVEGFTNTRIRNGMEHFKHNKQYIKSFYGRVKLDADERLAISPVQRADTKPKLRHQLFVEILGDVLINLENIDIDFDYSDRYKQKKTLTASILKHADTLESLSLASSLDNKDIFPEAAAYLIRRLPRLKVLDVDSTEVDREYLMRDAILSRPELEIIILVEPASLDDTWATCDWPPRLTVLDLDITPELSSAGLEALLQKLGPNLSCLRLDDCPNGTQDVDSLDLGARYNFPNLRMLVIGEVPMGIRFFERFATANIQFWTLGDAYRCTTEEVTQFIRDKRYPALEAFTVDGDSHWGAVNLLLLEEACNEVGVVFEREDATSTDGGSSENSWEDTDSDAVSDHEEEGDELMQVMAESNFGLVDAYDY